MKAVTLFGALRCRCCRETWQATWSTANTVLICHLCGDDGVVPVGIQVRAVDSPAQEGHAWAIQRHRALRCYS